MFKTNSSTWVCRNKNFIKAVFRKTSSLVHFPEKNKIGVRVNKFQWNYWLSIPHLTLYGWPWALPLKIIIWDFWRSGWCLLENCIREWVTFLKQEKMLETLLIEDWVTQKVWLALPSYSWHTTSCGCYNCSYLQSLCCKLDTWMVFHQYVCVHVSEIKVGFLQ